jgi:hypothetical protein
VRHFFLVGEAEPPLRDDVRANKEKFHMRLN